MKVLAMLVLFSTMSGSLWTSATQSAQPQHDAKPGLAITISTPRNRVEVGSPIMVSVAITSTSDHDVFPLAMKMSVLDSQGNPVPETRYGMKRHGTEPRPVVREVGPPVGHPGGSGSFFGGPPLHPGETFKGGRRIDVSREYDLSRPGTYTIQAREWQLPGKLMAESNTLTVTLVGSAPPPQQPVTSFSLYISDEEDKVRPSDKIPVHIEVTNTSDHDIIYVPSADMLDIQIRDANGDLAPLTDAGRKARRYFGTPGNNPQNIKPGDTLNMDVWAEGLYDLQPGDYTLQVLQFAKETNNWVKSNTLTITVTP